MRGRAAAEEDRHTDRNSDAETGSHRSTLGVPATVAHIHQCTCGAADRKAGFLTVGAALQQVRG
jgi:hypothetical protein